MTIEDLKKAAMSVQKMRSPELPKGTRWLTKIMARFGWHREYEVIIFDSKQIGGFPFYPPKIDL